MRSISFTLGSSLLCTTVDLESSSFLFLLLRPSRWRLNALARFILPDPVTLNRFLAPEFVFCFGIILFKNLDGKYRDTFYKTKPVVKTKNEQQYPLKKEAILYTFKTAWFIVVRERFFAPAQNIAIPHLPASASPVFYEVLQNVFSVAWEYSLQEQPMLLQ